MKNYIIYFITGCTAFLLLNCSGSTGDDNPKNWKRFTMYINSNDKNKEDALMVNKMRDDLGLDGIEWTKFQLVVDISKAKSEDHFIVTGDYDAKDVEVDLEASRYSFSQLSKEVQTWLLNSHGENKIQKPIFTQAVWNKMYKDDTNDTTSWTYFKILARTADDSAFFWLQKDISIEPLLESYAIIINISDMNLQNQYVILGDDDFHNPGFKGDKSKIIEFPWSQFSAKTRHGLLKWTGKNKIRLKQITK
jgi:hypothetical protein